MKYVNEFRNAKIAQALGAQIAENAHPDRHYKIMEICGGHTHTIYRHGIKDLLPPQVELVHGPGCPVCVLPMGRVDDGIAVAERPEVIFTCFGDMMRVPGSRGSLLEIKAQGADVRMVYSPLDALRIARENPDREVVFFAIGFETTAPSTALTLQRAKREGIVNFSVFCNHVTIVPPVRALLDSPDLRLDAFIGPGHVSTVIGCRPYEFISTDYGKPVAVAGFEPLDLLQAISMLMIQLKEGRCEVENQYSRIVPWEGNIPALRSMAEVFELRPYFEWRGLGFIALPHMPTLTPSCVSRCPASGWRTRKRVSAAKCSKACSSHGNAASSARPALLSTRWGPSWSRPKALVPPTTTSAAPYRIERRSARRDERAAGTRRAGTGPPTRAAIYRSPDRHEPRRGWKGNPQAHRGITAATP